MLSQYSAAMERRQSPFRRENSTPPALHVLNQPLRPNVVHRRNKSVEQSGRSQTHTHTAAHNQVGNTNIGQHQTQQHLQVAQQHSQAGPGSNQQITQNLHQPVFELSADEFRRWQHQQLDAHIDAMIRGQNTTSYENPHYVKIERSQSNPEAYSFMTSPVIPEEGLLQLNPNDGQDQLSCIPSGTYKSRPRSSTSNHAWQTQRWTSSPVPTTQGRPETPDQEAGTGCYLPVTPAATPHANRPLKVAGAPARRLSSSIEKVAMTFGRPIQPNPNQLERLCNSTSDSAVVTDPSSALCSKPPPLYLSNTSKRHRGDTDLPSPPHTATIQQSEHMYVALTSEQAFKDIPKLPFPSTEENNMQSWHLHQISSPQQSTLRASPESVQSYEFDFNDLSSAEDQSRHGRSPDRSSPSTLQYQDLWDSPQRAPIDLDLDATIEDTGISADEVQSYMSEQDLTTQKWTCLFPGCGKLFGRKENIRSHVQTHLGDRQYKCIHCNKRFVRQHDLKRHAKIHSGVKPYPCKCGNSFARHDALTRHRQRGICDGGFEGVVRKANKRGRPRKDRSNDDDEERPSKVARTRERNTTKSYASSVSGTSESSFPESPSTNFLDPIQEWTQFGHMENIQGCTAPSSSFTWTPPMSPQSAASCLSPEKTQSLHLTSSPSTVVPGGDWDEHQGTLTEQVHIHAEAENEKQLTKLNNSPPASHPGSPPELSHSSPPSPAQLLDLELSQILNSSATDSSMDTTQQDLSEPSFSLDMNGQLGDPMFDAMWGDSDFGQQDKKYASFAGDSLSFDDEVIFQ